jgi:phage terminase large subunit GpA-like protein
MAQRLKRLLRLLELPQPLNVWQWAEENRRLGKDVSAKPGGYRVASTPYQKDPQEDFMDPDVQVTVLLWASRQGKTEMLNNLEGFIIDHNPMNLLVCYPTLESAKKWSKQFFTPMVASTPALQRKISRLKRDSNNTILQKTYPGGTISAIGANSPSAFRQIQAPVVLCDEIDAMEDSPEGDPITLAFKRADNYHDSVQVLSSTPTVKGYSRIENWYEKSDKRQWFCPCPRCGLRQVLKWAQVRFDKEKPEEAVYVCEGCKAEMTDDERFAMVMAGEWRATAAFSGIRGYWLNGLNSVFPAKKGYKTKLHQFVSEFLDAKKQGKAALQTWTNTFLAETWEEESEFIAANPIYNRRENYGPKLPRAVLVLTAGVDIQDDRIEAECVGWGHNEESWGIEHKVFLGSPTLPGVWNELATWLEQGWKHESGVDLRIASAAIDSGAHTKYVYDFCRARTIKRIFAVKGSNGFGLPLVSRPRKSGVRRVLLFFIGTDTAKELIYSRLKLESSGPGFMHFPKEYDLEYFEQLTGERVFTRYVKGQRVKVWEKTRPRNEALDIRVYATAAFALRPQVPLAKLEVALTSRETEENAKESPNPALEQKLEEETEIMKSNAVANERKPIRRMNPITNRRRGGWVSAWRR